MMTPMLLLLACVEPDDSAGPEDSEPAGTGSYEVAWSADPSPITAGVQSEFTTTITGPDGAPVDDLQETHERIVHNVFVSEDLQSFQQLHMEDFGAVGADDLRTATFHFPLTLPYSGRTRVAFDYAHENQYLQTLDWIDVAGDVPQLDAPVEDDTSTRTVDDVVATIEWTVPPIAGFDAAFVIHLQDLDGDDVTDVVPWLGVDAYAIATTFDLAWIGHTHAWVPGMENAAPGAEMPHLYPGPDIELHTVYPTGGRYQMWVQFAREAAPSAPYTVPFQFEVSG